MIQEDAESFIALKLSGSHTENPTDPPAIHSRDAKDDYLLALAAKESAMLVTGDKDLLDIKGETLPIYTPKQFLELLQR